MPQVRRSLHSLMLHLATAPGNTSLFLKAVNGLVSVPGMMPPRRLLNAFVWLLAVSTGVPTLSRMSASTLLGLKPWKWQTALNAPALSVLNFVTMPSDASLVLLVTSTPVGDAAGAANANGLESAAGPGRQVAARVTKPERPEGRRREGEAASPGLRGRQVRRRDSSPRRAWSARPMASVARREPPKRRTIDAA